MVMMMITTYNDDDVHSDCDGDACDLEGGDEGEGGGDERGGRLASKN